MTRVNQNRNGAAYMHMCFEVDNKCTTAVYKYVHHYSGRQDEFLLLHESGKARADMCRVSCCYKNLDFLHQVAFRGRSPLTGEITVMGWHGEYQYVDASDSA